MSEDKCSRNMDGNGGLVLGRQLFPIRFWLTWMSLSLFFCSYDFSPRSNFVFPTNLAPSFTENIGRIFLDLNLTTFFHTLFQFWAGKNPQTKIRKSFSLDLFLLGIHDHRSCPPFGSEDFCFMSFFFSSRKSKLMFLEL